jgi:hypothetical protein
MFHVRGRVTRGRLVVDEPTDLPEGDVELVVVEEGNSEAWPAELDAELAARAADVEAGRFHTLEEVLTLLRTGG